MATNTPTTSVEAPTSKSVCAICRDAGSCSLCMQKSAMELNSGSGGDRTEFNSTFRNTELEEIKVESPTTASNGNYYGDAVQISTPTTNTDIIDVEQGGGSGGGKVVKKGERKWRYFPGKNRFYCNGRLITAPNISLCFCCFLLILVTFSLFIIFDGPYLAERWSIAVPILGSLLFFIVIVSMLKTTFSDPGIIPRASQQEAEYMDKLYSTNNVGRPPPRTKDIVVHGQTIKVKYCFTCKMFRPPRASHCGVCDNCVDRFDHHCPFLGNCVGKRNYRHFYSFVLSLSFLSVFVLSCATAHIVLISKEKGNFLEALKESPTSAVVMVISFFGMWTVLGLAGFHSYLISVEQTTNEDIKGSFGRSATKNPFSRGNIFLNCSYVLCGPVQPSLIDSRGKVTEDFLMSLPRKNDANGVPSTSVCNPGNLQLQTSIKTGPQCVDANASRQPGGALRMLDANQSLSSTQESINSQQQHSLNTSQASTNQNPNNLTTIGDGITLQRHSPDSGSGLLYSSASSNRSLGEAPSESMRNLYNSVEDDPTISPDSGSESYLSQNQERAEELRRLQQAFKEDFDDPTIILHSTPTPKLSQAGGHFPYEELDIDDPISANGLRRINSNESQNQNPRKRASSKSSLGESAISLSKKSKLPVPSPPSKIRTIRNPQQPLNNNNGVNKSTGGSGKSLNRSGASASSSTSNNANKARSSGKKLSKQTMIDSPLHLDPIT